MSAVTDGRRRRLAEYRPMFAAVFAAVVGWTVLFSQPISHAWAQGGGLPPLSGAGAPVNASPSADAPALAGIPLPPVADLLAGCASQEKAEQVSRNNMLTQSAIGLFFAVAFLFVRRFMAKRAWLTHGQQIMLNVFLAILATTIVAFLVNHSNDSLAQCMANGLFGKYIVLYGTQPFFRELILAGLPSGVAAFVLMLIFRG